MRGNAALYVVALFTSIDCPDVIRTAGAGINSRGDIVGSYVAKGGKARGFRGAAIHVTVSSTVRGGWRD